MSDVLLGTNLNNHQRTFESLLELRDIDDGAETQTANETGKNFNIRKHQMVAVVVDITACASNDNTETYDLVVAVSDVVGGTYTEIASLAVPRGTTGRLVIPVHGQTAELLDADCDWIRISATLGGDTPSITYGAFLAAL